MSEKHFLSLLIINSGWNEKIHLCNEKRGRKMGSYVHFCPRETGFENDQNGGWTWISTIKMIALSWRVRIDLIIQQPTKNTKSEFQLLGKALLFAKGNIASRLTI